MTNPTPNNCICCKELCESPYIPVCAHCYVRHRQSVEKSNDLEKMLRDVIKECKKENEKREQSFSFYG